MAYLSNEQILQILQKGNKPEEIDRCNKHDIRAKFHVEPTLEDSNQPYREDFLRWVGGIINKQKHEVFKHLLTCPIETVEFTEGIFDELIKVFEAQDRYIGYEFTNPELANDFTQFLSDIGDDVFWQTKGFQAMKSAINSIVVLDLPAIQEAGDRFPRPYYYFLDVAKVKDFQVNALYKFEYIIFENKFNADILHAFDDGFFRTYSRRAGLNKVNPNEPTQGTDWELVSEAKHELGYTPVRSFWTTPFEQRSRLQKRGPQSNSLGKLDWLLLLYTFSKHAELYAGFPIDVMYEQRCDYRDQQGNECKGGKVSCQVSDGNGAYVTSVTDCPSCKDKAILGPGTILTAPARASNEDPDMLQGMNRISADKDSLEYLLNRVDRYEATISTNMIGYIPDSIRQAMNKDQIGSQIESQMNCLAEVRDNFQAIHKFVLETLARLRYGNNALLSLTCHYGNKWFIHSVEKLQEQFKESKSNGFATFELSSQFEQILLTKYKNNPSMIERVRTLSAIEPYQNYTVSDLATLNEKFGLNEKLMRLKIDFSNYVNRFEREFMDVGIFMRFMPFETKVNFILEKMFGYVDEDYPEEEDDTPPPGTPPGTPPGAPPGTPPTPPVNNPVE